jgi:LuxR family transcriptional regulator, maltose regulon positive regulatory protein
VVDTRFESDPQEAEAPPRDHRGGALRIKIGYGCEDSCGVGPKVRSETGDAPVAPGVRRGIVSRRQLFERLTGAGRIVQLSAPAGSGKTILLRSWIRDAGLAESAAWVSVGSGERDPQQLWISVVDALRHTGAGSRLVRHLTAAPDLDGWAVVERLLEDLAALEEPIWLVIDDLHELRSNEALRQLELMLMRSPPELRFVLASRHDLRLGLHRLRLEGELIEIRAADLRFTLEEARVLLEAAEVDLSDSALALLIQRTEGWAAGLRMAALSLAGHPDPERFAAEFSGSERTVAEYLLAEVLDRQPEEVRRLLLRTSMLERVNGPLADLLTGGSGGERILGELEEANAFVVPLDAGRSWFRYHHLFADLLQLELRRTAPGELFGLHGSAAEWYVEHGYPIEAIRHAQAARNWSLAARLLSDIWFSLEINGQGATASELLAGFPAGTAAADAELVALMAFDELSQGSLDGAERHLALATGGLASMPVDRRGRFEVTLAVLRLAVARLRGDLPAVVEEAQRLLAPAGAPDASQPGVGDDLRALALISLGIAELWSNRAEEAERHLEQGVALARQIKRPFLEINALGHWAFLVRLRSFALATERSMQAIELARRHGWSDERIVFAAYVTLGNTLVWQGRLEEGERWLEHVERVIRAEADPTARLMLYIARGSLEAARGRDGDALAAFRAAERQADSVVTPHTLATQARALILRTLLRMGKIEPVEQALADMEEEERAVGDTRTVLAGLQVAQGDPQAATVTLAPVIDGSAPVTNRGWVIHALVLDAIARDAIGDADGADQALERALDIVEPDGAVLPFLVYPAPRLLERHSRRRTAHASLVSEILNLLAGRKPASAQGDEDRLREPLSESESRILRYLPTNLSVPEIANEVYLSVNTVKTHMRHLYAKLGAHRRGHAVQRARALGLLAPSGVRIASRSR